MLADGFWESDNLGLVSLRSSYITLTLDVKVADCSYNDEVLILQVTPFPCFDSLLLAYIHAEGSTSKFITRFPFISKVS
jgi:hypothetical protein